MTYAFVFDASACSGCKACQVACKDRNNLPVGVSWRRVYEVSGGSWESQGLAWTNSIFAYNLSMACNHCVHPKCAGVCPTDAYLVRPDGIVCIDATKCVGCGYCAWACPYDAPQIDVAAGIMTKCNLCAEDLDLGLPPACVASCPMRCLEVVDVDNQGAETMGVELWKVPGTRHLFPLPAFSRTEPHLVIKPHPGVNHIAEGAQVSNREEVSPASSLSTSRREIPLLIFTLLVQMAIGAFWAIFIIYCGLGDKNLAWQITRIPLLAVGVTTSAALLVSFLHLGRPRNAWRVLNHLRKSWLSREILFLSAFTGLWGIHTGLRLFNVGNFALQTSSAGLTALCGLAALYSMQNIYQLRSVPGWNTWRTRLEFTVTTVVLGSLLTGALLPQEPPAGMMIGIVLAASFGFLASGLVSLSFADTASRRPFHLRLGLILAGLSGIILLPTLPPNTWTVGMFAIFLLALAEECIGRWLFYTRRKPNI
jgi:anaerobic dimethyl sulfoxide reductase subunit B (iron-sulfur subunit)